MPITGRSRWVLGLAFKSKLAPTDSVGEAISNKKSRLMEDRSGYFSAGFILELFHFKFDHGIHIRQVGWIDVNKQSFFLLFYFERPVSP